MFGREDFRTAREAHYEHFFGPVHAVGHSMSVDLLPMHIDVYQFAPTPTRSFWTLITGGMSDFRQPALAEANNKISPLAEIIMYAHQPKDWMLAVLKGLAEMPLRNATFLHWGHTVPNGQPMTHEPSQLTSFFFLPPVLEAQGFERLTLATDRVDFLMLVPITEAERAYAIEHGAAALGQLMEDNGFDFIVDEKRMSLL